MREIINFHPWPNDVDERANKILEGMATFYSRNKLWNQYRLLWLFHYTQVYEVLNRQLHEEQAE